MKDDTFFGQVYEIVKCIPPGRVTSYGAIARFLGTGRSARMVGWAMNASHSQLENVPAHRVVNRVGLLTGKHHFEGEHVMKQLLESEGIKISGDKVVNFSQLFWDPSKEYAL